MVLARSKQRDPRWNVKEGTGAGHRLASTLLLLFPRGRQKHAHAHVMHFEEGETPQFVLEQRVTYVEISRIR